MRVSAIDIGTNSVRLLVADIPPDAGLSIVDRGLEITRLGEGMAGRGGIVDAAADRTLAAVKRFTAIARTARAETILLFGTCALREAANGGSFTRRVKEATGLGVRVLSGEEEAGLAWRGITRTLSRPLDGTAAIDIGGGSVEITAAPGGGTPVSASIGIGCVRMTERFLLHDPPGTRELDALRAFASRSLASGISPSVPRPASRLVGAGGTITAAAAIDLGLHRYDPDRVHGALLPAAGVRALAVRLAAMPLAERKSVPGIEEKRADIIVAGLVVLEAVMGFFDAAEITVSDEGILHGALLELCGQ
jgi:exopolyphosphatase/guanosine-5'-triphosphate,3'-diphosphate pyrophosphatase